MMLWRRSLSEYCLFLASSLIQHLFYSKKQLPDKLESILLIKLDHIGDVLLSLPILANLRAAFPEAHITMMAGTWMRELLESHPHIDEVLCYNAPFFARSVPSTPLRMRWMLLRALRSRHEELIVDLRGSWLTLLAAATRCARYRLDRASRNVSWGFHRNAPEHELDRNLEVLASIPKPHCVPDWPVQTDQIFSAWNFLSSRGVVLKRPIFAIHPGSPVALKCWPPDRFIELADALIARYDAQVLFVGASGESDLIDRIQVAMHHDSWNLAGQTTLTELLGILKNCTGFIGNDSGPMHLAAAVGIPTVGIFGPSSPGRFGPIGPHVRCLRHKPDCPPCMADRCKFHDGGCVGEVSVEDVLKALDDPMVPCERSG